MVEADLFSKNMLKVTKLFRPLWFIETIRENLNGQFVENFDITRFYRSEIYCMIGEHT